MTRILRGDAGVFASGVLAAFDGLCDDRLANSIIQVAETPDITDGLAGTLIESVLVSGPPAARAAARSTAMRLASQVGSTDPRAAGRAIAVAARLVLQPAPDWGTIVDEFSQHSDSFRAIVLAAAPLEERRVHLLSMISETDLADLFFRLVGLFPYAGDRQIQDFEAHAVGADDSAREWRGETLRALERRGTENAIVALRDLRRRLPSLTWLGKTISNAVSEAARLGWASVSPREFQFLRSAVQRRIIRDGTDLPDVICESRERFQQALTGDTPMVEGLWDRLSRFSFRPKPEATLANALKRHLDQELKIRGVVTNREVEIDQGGGGCDGARTDIFVQVAIPTHGGQFARTTVVIEVKGAWHPSNARRQAPSFRVHSSPSL